MSTTDVRASNATSPGNPTEAMTTRTNATASGGERQAQPRRSAIRLVQKPALTPATHPANALRATMNTRIHIRAGAHASGSSVASASMTTPASPTIEYPSTCSRSSWTNAAIAARTIDATAIPRTKTRADPTSTRSGATEASIHASATTASAAGATAVRNGREVSGTTSVRRAAQRWNGMAPKRIATATANARYARPKTTGWAASWLRSRPNHAVAAIASAPATTTARVSRI